MKIGSCACTRKGYRKKVNQDALLLKVALINKERVAFAVICDGMGGLERGEIASAQCIRTMEQWFYEGLPDLIDAYYEKTGPAIRMIIAVKEDWKKRIAQINIQLAGYGRLHDKKLGSTILAVLLIGQTYLVMHIGDGRLFYVFNRQRMQLTEDQTYVRYFVKKKILTQKEAENHPQAHVLLQCVGASQAVIPEFYEGKLEHKMSFLLCSDGFWKRAEMKKVYEMMEKSYRMSDCRMEQKMEDLISRCRKEGETDDISAIMLTVKKINLFTDFISHIR